MSNLLTIQATEFKNVPQGDVSYGFRAYDNEDAEYVNTLESIPENDLDLLDDIVANIGYSEVISEMLSFVCEMENGININGTYYDWEDIQPIFEKHEFS